MVNDTINEAVEKISTIYNVGIAPQLGTIVKDGENNSIPTAKQTRSRFADRVDDIANKKWEAKKRATNPWFPTQAP